MNWENKGRSTVIQPPIFIELTEEEKQVLNGLDGAIEHIDVLALRLNKPVSAISVILLTMELKGILKSYPGNKYGIYAA
jgi:DNA processing protein